MQHFTKLYKEYVASNGQNMRSGCFSREVDQPEYVTERTIREEFFYVYHTIMRSSVQSKSGLKHRNKPFRAGQKYFLTISGKVSNPL